MNTVSDRIVLIKDFVNLEEIPDFLTELVKWLVDGSSIVESFIIVVTKNDVVLRIFYVFCFSVNVCEEIVVLVDNLALINLVAVNDEIHKDNVILRIFAW